MSQSFSPEQTQAHTLPRAVATIAASRGQDYLLAEVEIMSRN